MSTNKVTTDVKQQNPGQRQQHQASISRFFQSKTSSSASSSASQCNNQNNNSNKKRRIVQQLGTQKPLKDQNQEVIEILDSNDDDDEEDYDDGDDESTKKNEQDDDIVDRNGNNNDAAVSGTFAGTKNTVKISNQPALQNEAVDIDKDHNYVGHKNPIKSTNNNDTNHVGVAGSNILDERNSTQTLAQAEPSTLATNAASSTGDCSSISSNRITVPNPFAHFAAAPNSAASFSPSSENPIAASSARWPRPTTTTTTTISTIINREEAGKKAKPKATSSSAAAVTAVIAKKRAKKKKNSDWIKMADLPMAQQEQIVTKWHSFLPAVPARTIDEHHLAADNDDDDELYLEHCRFLILVAARLHAQCQEASVHKAMTALREHFGNDVISAPVLARANPQDWDEVCISNLHYYHTKARHIQQAAHEIMTDSRFLGKVPEQAHELMTLTGIGPILADVLAFVNTREQHEKRIKSRKDEERKRQQMGRHATRGGQCLQK
jgi:endonuclease III